MGGLTEHVFGYGSLAREPTGGHAIATLRDRRRVLGVAADNGHAVPGYKRYLDADGDAPAILVAFLDLAAARGAAVNGVLFEVDEAELAVLDARERNYDRVDVTAAIESPPAGRVWTYVGSADGRARLATGLREGRAVVARSYLESVHAAFRALGDAEYRRFVASSDLDGLPIRDLERVDLPPAEPPR